jgi:hypothetical protein
MTIDEIRKQYNLENVEYRVRLVDGPSTYTDVNFMAEVLDQFNKFYYYVEFEATPNTYKVFEERTYSYVWDEDDGWICDGSVDNVDPKMLLDFGQLAMKFARFKEEQRLKSL